MIFQYFMLVADNDLTRIDAIMKLPVYDFFYGVSFLIDKSKLK